MDSTTRIGDNNNLRYKRPIRNKRYNRYFKKISKY